MHILSSLPRKRETNNLWGIYSLKSAPFQRMFWWDLYWGIPCLHKMHTRWRDLKWCRHKIFSSHFYLTHTLSASLLLSIYHPLPSILPSLTPPHNPSPYQAKATVKRDGKWSNIDAGEVVPGDLVLLACGSAIPADSRINEGQIEVDQAALTGESLPVTMYKVGYNEKCSVRDSIRQESV